MAHTPRPLLAFAWGSLLALAGLGWALGPTLSEPPDIDTLRVLDHAASGAPGCSPVYFGRELFCHATTGLYRLAGPSSPLWRGGSLLLAATTAGLLAALVARWSRRPAGGLLAVVLWLGRPDALHLVAWPAAAHYTVALACGLGALLLIPGRWRLAAPLLLGLGVAVDPAVAALLPALAVIEGAGARRKPTVSAAAAAVVVLVWLSPAIDGAALLRAAAVAPGGAGWHALWATTAEAAVGPLVGSPVAVVAALAVAAAAAWDRRAALAATTGAVWVGALAASPVTPDLHVLLPSAAWAVALGLAVGRLPRRGAIALAAALAMLQLVAQRPRIVEDSGTTARTAELARRLAGIAPQVRRLVVGCPLHEGPPQALGDPERGCWSGPGLQVEARANTVAALVGTLRVSLGRPELAVVRAKPQEPPRPADLRVVTAGTEQLLLDWRGEAFVAPVLGHTPLPSGAKPATTGAAPATR